jgi:gluconate 2-dehydrogenase gamma chain
VPPPAGPPADGIAPGRRIVLIAGAMLPVVRWLPVSAALPGRGEAVVTSYRFLSGHQAATVIEATARLVPGPQDDPTEVGHPGAREAGVVHFIDRLLSAFEEDPPAIFAGAPWSDRHTSGPDYLKRFVPLIERQEKAWRKRVTQLRKQVAAAVVALDKGAVSDGYKNFVSAPTTEQDKLLTDLADARDVLFGLTIDAMYSVPEYSGNHDQSAWHEIKWPGDIQPVGYSAKQVESDDGPDPVSPADLASVQELIDALPILSRARAARRSTHG